MVLLAGSEHVLIRRLDTNDDSLKISRTHKVDHFLIMPQIHWCLSYEVKGFSSTFQPGDEFLQEVLSMFSAADEVVIDHEHGSPGPTKDLDNLKVYPGKVCLLRRP